MAERDPFGRSPDENPLAGLGSLSDGTQSQAAEPAIVAADEDWSGSEPTARPDPPPRAKAAEPRQTPPKQPPRTGNAAMDQSLAEVIRQAEAMSGTKVVHSVRVFSRAMKLVWFLIVIGIIAAIGGSIIGASKDVRDAINIPSAPEINIPGTANEPGSSSASENLPTPAGLSSRSMFVRSNFRAAMDRLSKSGLGRMRTLSVRPERIDAQLLTKGGSLRSVQIRFDDRKINDFGAGSPGFGHLETIPFSQINTAAPGRLVRSAAGRLKRPASQIDYVVLLSFAGKPMWSVFSKTGTHFQGDVRGRISRRLN